MCTFVAFHYFFFSTWGVRNGKREERWEGKLRGGQGEDTWSVKG